MKKTTSMKKEKTMNDSINPMTMSAIVIGTAVVGMFICVALYWIGTILSSHSKPRYPQWEKHPEVPVVRTRRGSQQQRLYPRRLTKEDLKVVTMTSTPSAKNRRPTLGRRK